jgi:hypothetical protein
MYCQTAVRHMKNVCKMNHAKAGFLPALFIVKFTTREHDTVRYHQKIEMVYSKTIDLFQKCLLRNSIWIAF